jgi:hypothetical protein
MSDSKLQPVRLQVNANYRAQLHKTDWVLLHGITDVTCCQRPVYSRRADTDRREGITLYNNHIQESVPNDYALTSV